MKFSHLLLAAGLCSFSAASAQTTPTQTPPGTGTATPSTVPSGTAPMPSNPNGAVSAGEVFTTGAPNSNKTKTVKSKKQKASMSSSGSSKTKNGL